MYLRELEQSVLIRDRHGATVEEMTIEVNKTKADLDNAEHELRSLAALNNVGIDFPMAVFFRADEKV